MDRHPFFSLLFIFFLWLSCAVDVPENATDYLAPPVITNVYQNAGDTERIYVDFYGSNNEYYFEGYNVYVLDQEMLRASVASYTPVQVDLPGYASAIPSYPMQPSDSQTGTITIILNQYLRSDGNIYPFENNVRYWIMLGSYHKYLKVREHGVSNQVSILFTK